MIMIELDYGWCLDSWWRLTQDGLCVCVCLCVFDCLRAVCQWFKDEDDRFVFCGRVGVCLLLLFSRIQKKIQEPLFFV